MMEKGSRKTAPPDTARVKVHRYILKMKSNMVNAVVQLIFTLNTNQIYLSNPSLLLSYSYRPAYMCTQ